MTRVLCIVDRGEGAAEAFAARGLTLEALFGREDLPVAPAAPDATAG